MNEIEPGPLTVEENAAAAGLLARMSQSGVTDNVLRSMRADALPPLPFMAAVERAHSLLDAAGVPRIPGSVVLPFAQAR